MTKLRTMFDDRFSDGLEGWTGLVAAGENFYPLLHPASVEGGRSMILDTCGGVQNVTAYATKRSYAYAGIVRWYSRFAWSAEVLGVGGSAGPEQNGLRYLRWAVDWQRGNEITGQRHWWEIRYRHYDESGGAITPIWEASDGSANAYNAIAGLAGYELGYNQANKYDFHELVITFDSVRKRWISVALDGKLVDIRHMPGGALQSGVAEFDNGSNFVFGCQNRSNNSSADPFMLVDRTWAAQVLDDDELLDDSWGRIEVAA